ncbi:MAG TPA: alpha/beta fold hydrolase [Geminicoccaceae bacterium]|nr:alpha/beta fold hydrolase [Geminicoccaceae bacterium]
MRRAGRRAPAPRSRRARCRARRSPAAAPDHRTPRRPHRRNRQAPRPLAATPRALAALDLEGELARIRNPTLIVVGAEDQATPPALGRALADRLPDASLLELPGLGHCPHIQDPDAFAAAIAPFLALSQRP